MALQPCRECGKEVSTEAAQCPHCGVGHPTKKMTPSAQGCLGCLGVLVVFWIIGTCAGSGTSSSSSPSGSRGTNTSVPRGPGNEYHAVRTANVRKSPSASAPLVRSLQPGDVVWLAPSKTSGWMVMYGARSRSDTVGFIASSLVNSGPVPELLLMEYDWQSSSRYASPRIVGSVKNMTGREMRYVQISWTLFDSQDREVGTAWTNHTNLGPGAVWRFEALVLHDEARKYRLASLGSR